jgi:hypothetical protein
MVMGDPANWTLEQMLERHDEHEELLKQGRQPSAESVRELNEASDAYMARWKARRDAGEESPSGEPGGA